MANIEADMLATVRSILRGQDETGKKITRKDIVGLPPRVLAYLAWAIMCAQPDKYLEVQPDGRYVKGMLSAAIEKIIVTGVPHPKKVNPPEIAAIGRRAGLYHVVPGRGGSKPIRLMESPTLTALTAFASEPGVAAFCDEVDEANRLSRLPDITLVTGNEGSDDQKATRIVAWLEGLEPGVHAALTAKLQQP